MDNENNSLLLSFDLDCKVAQLNVKLPFRLDTAEWFNWLNTTAKSFALAAYNQFEYFLFSLRKDDDVATWYISLVDEGNTLQTVCLGDSSEVKQKRLIAAIYELLSLEYGD